MKTVSRGFYDAVSSIYINGDLWMTALFRVNANKNLRQLQLQKNY